MTTATETICCKMTGTAWSCGNGSSVTDEGTEGPMEGARDANVGWCV